MYKKIKNGIQRTNEDGSKTWSSQPEKDFPEYSKWLEEGNIPEPEFTEKKLAEKQAQEQKAEAQKYLDDTDFYFTVDKYNSLSDKRKLELERKRQEARDIVNG